jgi:hypothetical protein
LIYDSFEELEEITFEIRSELWSMVWWECVIDAMREGWCCGCERKGRRRGACGNGVGKGNSQELTLNVEYSGRSLSEKLPRG